METCTLEEAREPIFSTVGPTDVYGDLDTHGDGFLQRIP